MKLLFQSIKSQISVQKIAKTNISKSGFFRPQAIDKKDLRAWSIIIFVYQNRIIFDPGNNAISHTLHSLPSQQLAQNIICGGNKIICEEVGTIRESVTQGKKLKENNVYPNIIASMKFVQFPTQ